ncbi:MAG: flagellar biosynthesis protein FlhB [Acetobacteraceae bacterium]
MSGASESAEERTEAATPRRLEKAREQGNVPVSREFAGFAAMAAACAALYMAAPVLLSATGRTMALFLAGSGEPALAGPAGLRIVAEAWFRLAFPVLGAALVAGATAVLLQTGFLLHLGAAAPKLSRVNPMAGLKRIFGTDGVVEIVKSLAKMLLLLAVMWAAVRHDLTRILRQPLQDPHRLPLDLGRCVLDIMLAGLGVQAVVAGADLFWVRFRYARQMRMSHHDIREEMRETDGNPQIKMRIRRIRLQRARRRMMAAVPKATVVVTNPTHYAVALAYDRGNSPAPKVVAKGVDTLALKIREIAATHGVPMVANPPLARALWRVELDTDIPVEHYKAVAEIIAYVWRLRRTAS